MNSPNTSLEDFVRSLPLFSLVEQDELVDIVRLLQPVNLNTGEVLFRQGTPGNAMWILSHPTAVSLSLNSQAGKAPLRLTEAHNGQTVGEMALVDEEARSATAVVTEAGPAYRIDATDFYALKDSYRSAAFKVLRRICIDLCSKLREGNDRVTPTIGASDTRTAPLEMRPAKIEDISAFVPFRQLPEVVKLALTTKVKVVKLDASTVLFQEGEPADATYFVVEGQADVKRREKTLTTLGPSQFVGLLACIDGRPRSATVSTQGSAQLLRLAQRDFDFLFSQRNRAAFQIVDMIARQLVSSVRATNEQARKKAERAGNTQEMEAIDLALELSIEEI